MIHLWPGEVRATEYGDRAALVGIREFFVDTPYGPAPVRYLLYRIRDGVPVGERMLPTVHAEFQLWSFDWCTEVQRVWMAEHQGHLRYALRVHLERVQFSS